MARNAKRMARRRKIGKKAAGVVKQWVTLEKRIKRIEEFLEPDLTTFHEKHKLAQLDIVDAEIAH